MNFSLKQTRWCCEAAFFVFVLLFLGVYNADYLYRIQAENLFLANAVFAGETLPQSAGVLVYLSKWLLQLCYYPLLGAAVVGAGLVCIGRLLSALTGVESFTRLLMLFVVPLSVLMAQASAGYAIYENFDTSFFVSFELGMIVSLLLALLGESLLRKNGKVGFSVCSVLAVVLHLLIGLYAPLSLLLIGAGRWRKEQGEAVKLMVAGLVIALLVPLLETSIYQENYIFALLAPLPNPYFFNVFAYGLLSLVLAVVVTAAGADCSVERLEKVPFFATSFALLLVLSFFFSFRDANCRTLLEMQRRTENHDWEGVLESAGKVERPTRAIAAYRYIALLETGKLSEKLFDFPVRYDTLNSPYPNIDPIIFYPDLFFYSSQLNMSLFWGMEAWTNAHRSVNALKRSAIVALIQGEKELALKYMEQLKQTMFYAGWAEEMEKYAGRQQAFFNAYPIFGKTYASQIPEPVFAGTYDLPTLFSTFTNLDPDNMERRMLLELYAKKTEKFMDDLRIVKGMYRKQMPVCMQEVVCLYALNANLDVRRLFPIDPEVNNRVANFVYNAKNYANSREEGAEALKEYRGMYVYYLLFGNPYPSAANLKKSK